MSEIRPDEFFKLNITNIGENGEDYEAPVNAKYDRLDRFEGIGRTLLKVYMDDVGYLLTFVDDDHADMLHETTGIPIIEREFIYESEYNLYINAIARELNEAMFGIDIDEQAIIEDENGNG